MSLLTDNERATLDELLLHPVFLKAAKVIQDRYIPLGKIDDDIKWLEGVSGADRVTYQHFRSSGVFMAFSGLLILTKSPHVPRSSIHGDPRSHGAWSEEDSLSPEEVAEAKAVKDRLAKYEAEEAKTRAEAAQKRAAESQKKA